MQKKSETEISHSKHSDRPIAGPNKGKYVYLFLFCISVKAMRWPRRSIVIVLLHSDCGYSEVRCLVFIIIALIIYNRSSLL